MKLNSVNRLITRSINRFLFVSSFFILSSFAHAVFPGEDKILFGIEYSFQDQEMVNEKGRNTMVSDHKKKKLKEFLNYYLKEKNISSENVELKKGFKEGVFVNVPGDGTHVINMEPVTIEVNTTPKYYHQILDAAQPIMKAAGSAGLVPYVQPAAERSGMGHIHVGAKNLEENPFFRNPTLLRNTMVYYHQHPSLLYGFAEAYDIGMNSNVETYHSLKRQKAFQKAVQEFDEWYLRKKNLNKSVSFGMFKFLAFLDKYDSDEIGFFRHYRHINLEHLEEFVGYDEPINFTSFDELKKITGKQTVEFRIFRPQKTAEHARANAELLLKVFEFLHDESKLVPFKVISESEFSHFYNASVISNDWNVVKSELKLKSPLSDSMLQELVDAVHTHPIHSLSANNRMKRFYPDLEIFNAYSEKQMKGHFFELRFPVSAQLLPYQPDAMEKMNFKRVDVGGKKYWTTTLNTESMLNYQRHPCYMWLRDVL